MNITEDRRTVLIIITSVIAGLLFLSGNLPFLTMSPGYTTAYEGAKVRFIGLKSPNGTLYLTGETHDASVAGFDTQLKFDPDDLLYDQCNLRGEMTSVYIPSSTFSQVLPAWVPTEWEMSINYITNPRARYDWDIPNIDGSTTAYAMEEWLTKFFFSISAEFDTGPDYFMTKDESNNQRYLDWEVWFEFNIEPNWYFEDAMSTYFAIAKVELAEFKLGAEDKYGAEVTPCEETSIIPMSPPSILYLSYAPFGATEVKGEDELKTFYTRDVALNTDFFRDKVYGYITLANFGTGEWGPLWDRRAKGDVVTMGFNVYQFIVGEWEVKEVADDVEIDDYDRASQTGRAGIGEAFENVLEGIGNFLSSPGGGLLGIAVVVVAAIAVLSFTPALGQILGAIMGRKSGDD